MRSFFQISFHFCTKGVCLVVSPLDLNDFELCRRVTGSAWCENPTVTSISTSTGLIRVSLQPDFRLRSGAPLISMEWLSGYDHPGSHADWFLTLPHSQSRQLMHHTTYAYLRIPLQGVLLVEFNSHFGRKKNQLTFCKKKSFAASDIRTHDRLLARASPSGFNKKKWCYHLLLPWGVTHLTASVGVLNYDVVVVLKIDKGSLVRPTGEA